MGKKIPVEEKSDSPGKLRLPESRFGLVEDIADLATDEHVNDRCEGRATH